MAIAKFFKMFPHENADCLFKKRKAEFADEQRPVHQILGYKAWQSPQRLPWYKASHAEKPQI